MGLVSFLPPVRQDIPHEPGEWMEFKKPSGAIVREARVAAESEGRKGVRDFGPEIVKAFMSGDDDDKAVRRTQALERASTYNPSNFDRATLLRSTITAWSYVTPEGIPVPVSAETIAELDEATAQWAHEAVVALLKPPTAEDSKSPTGAGASRA